MPSGIRMGCRRYKANHKKNTSLPGLLSIAEQKQYLLNVVDKQSHHLQLQQLKHQLLSCDEEDSVHCEVASDYGFMLSADLPTDSNGSLTCTDTSAEYADTLQSLLKLELLMQKVKAREGILQDLINAQSQEGTDIKQNTCVFSTRMPNECKVDESSTRDETKRLREELARSDAMATALYLENQLVECELESAAHVLHEKRMLEARLQTALEVSDDYLLLEDATSTNSDKQQCNTRADNEGSELSRTPGKSTDTNSKVCESRPSRYGLRKRFTDTDKVSEPCLARPNPLERLTDVKTIESCLARPNPLERLTDVKKIESCLPSPCPPERFAGIEDERLYGSSFYVISRTAISTAEEVNRQDNTQKSRQLPECDIHETQRTSSGSTEGMFIQKFYSKLKCGHIKTYFPEKTQTQHEADVSSDTGLDSMSSEDEVSIRLETFV